MNNAALLNLSLIACEACGRTLTLALGVWATLGSFTIAATPQPTVQESLAEPFVSLSPASMPRIGTIDERFQSYNVEMLEVTGGKFWRPYGPEFDALLKKARRTPSLSTSNTPTGMDPALYQYRPPIDLKSPRLRELAAALGPAYMRVSGTWANTTFFADADPAPKEAPPGFTGVLTRNQWRGVIEFAGAVDAMIVSSFAVGSGVRDAQGVWTPAQARLILDYTKSIGGRIAAAEFMNEPTLAAMGGAPRGYDAAAYGRDFKVFQAFVRETAPDMLILGPGSVGETVGPWGLAYGSLPVLKTGDLLAATASPVDAFSYHHYGASSQRCATFGMPGTTAAAALSEEWLARTEQTLAFYRKMRDEFEPGKPFWVTETADAACGGNPWAASFLDSFRYLDQLGRLAKQNVLVIMHNTLASSDYGLLNEQDLTPRPNYWSALLWRKLMGATVLESGVPIQAGMHIYAHCLRGNAGGVAVLVLNTDKKRSRRLSVPLTSKRFTLSTHELEGGSVALNGAELRLGAHDRLPALRGLAIAAGTVTLSPATINFFAVREAHNPNCR
ncbi:MAG: hypothetical protein ACLQBA_17820 [Candidatus Binataceae bacterium]